MRKRCSEKNSIDEAQLTASSCSCESESRSMIHACADYRQAKGDIHPFHSLPFTALPIIDEANRLNRDMPLIMVHRDNGIIPAAKSFREYAVRGYRSDCIDAVLHRLLASGNDLINLLRPEKAMLS